MTRPEKERRKREGEMTEGDSKWKKSPCTIPNVSAVIPNSGKFAFKR